MAKISFFVFNYDLKSQKGVYFLLGHPVCWLRYSVGILEFFWSKTLSVSKYIFQNDECFMEKLMTFLPNKIVFILGDSIGNVWWYSD